MKSEDVLEVFKQAGALLEGHFILSSGLRSPFFLQKALVFQDPKRTEKLCHALSKKILLEYGAIDFIVSPAIGGILPGYETARALGIQAVYLEREQGIFVLRRGFHIPQYARVILVEDIITTGLSVRECLSCLEEIGVSVLAVACIIDRSGGKVHIGKPLLSLAEVHFPVYQPDQLPAELACLEAIKPGSRDLF